ncbi:hypothetical protein [Jiella mangrovi]|uniref:VapC45 PIN like domain-containing protein n=1 Tax=Jiella mangrovi TaxID=2821407 RepID=A0ABS4BEN7_9HYPH|nr:hypothetical protein [Jiella mangrovi]MBP0614631.1 hypothetical protein [Jiella mangrovi]
MKALLDESVPKAVARLLGERALDASKFPNDWKGLRNGDLLRRLVEKGYDCLITCDKNLLFQQSTRSLGIGIIVLPSQNVRELQSIGGSIAAAYMQVRPGLPLIIRRDGGITPFDIGRLQEK